MKGEGINSNESMDDELLLYKLILEIVWNKDQKYMEHNINVV